MAKPAPYTAEIAADRMAAAIEKFMPLLRDLWASFPDVEDQDDVAAATRMERAAEDWRKAQGQRQRPPVHDAQFFQPVAD